MSRPNLAVVRGKDREFSQVDDGHFRLTSVSLGVMLEVTRLRRERHELIGELTVTCDFAGARTIEGVLSVGDWNLSSVESRNRRAKHLAARSEAEDIDWESFLEELAQKTIFAQRQGTPGHPLGFYEKPGPQREFDIHGWRLLREHPTIAFGDGGTAKSYLALWAAGILSQQGITTLYVDWELNGSEHRDRLERLFGEQLPSVNYLPCDQPITVEADRIHREVRRLNAEYVIFDSIAFATSGPPESAEHATAYFRIVRQLNVGTLHLAHVNRSESGDQKPFGSTFWHNAARSTWFLQQADEQQIDSTHITIGLFNRKNNCTRRYPALAFDVDFGSDFTQIARTDPASDPGLAKKLNIGQRLRHLLGHGPMTLHAIAEELDVKMDSLEKTINRHSRSFVRVPGVDGIARIALAVGS